MNVGLATVCGIVLIIDSTVYIHATSKIPLGPVLAGPTVGLIPIFSHVTLNSPMAARGFVDD
jgi:hypothetical protein